MSRNIQGGSAAPIVLFDASGNALGATGNPLKTAPDTSPYAACDG